MSTNAGAKLYICSTPTAATSSSAYAALTWVEVKGIESIGEFGPEFAISKHKPLDGSAVEKMKGSKDNGDPEVSMLRKPLDPGQIALMAALNAKFAYPFKITAEDSADANDTDSLFYFQAVVGKGRTQFNGADENNMRSVTLGITGEMIEVPSVVVP